MPFAAPRLALAAFGALSLAACTMQPLAPGLQQAGQNYPPMIIGSNTQPTDGNGPYALSCPKAGGRVEQRGQPAMEFLGTDPSNPDLCRMRIANLTMTGWYGIWVTYWPGAAAAYPALKRVIHGPTGTVAGFDTVIEPGLEWHDLIRNEGIEDISLLGHNYHALKISHYREGFGGDTYRSVSTVWKDIPTGLLIYGTYQHIAGRPEIDDPIIPTAILPAR